MSAWRAAALVLAWLAIAPGAAWAGPWSAAGPHAAGLDADDVGLQLELVDGERPAVVPGGDYEQTVTWLEWRGRRMRQLFTDPGSQVGFDHAVRVGWVQPETPGPSEPSPVAVHLAGAVAMRVHAFNVPVPGSLSAVAGVELALGGGRWWSDGTRLGGLVGLRLHAAPGGPSRLELGWTLAPHLLGDFRNGLQRDHAEHRVHAGVGWGSLGVTASLGLGRQSVVAEGAVSAQSGSPTVTRSRVLTVGVAWRLL